MSLQLFIVVNSCIIEKSNVLINNNVLLLGLCLLLILLQTFIYRNFLAFLYTVKP